MWIKNELNFKFDTTSEVLTINRFQKYYKHILIVLIHSSNK